MALYSEPHIECTNHRLTSQFFNVQVAHVLVSARHSTPNTLVATPQNLGNLSGVPNILLLCVDSKLN